MDALHNVIGGPVMRVKTAVKNLSSEGVCIETGSEITKGAMLELEVMIPGDNMPVMATGEVAWSSKSGEASYESGVRITKIERFDRARLLDFVYNEWLKSKKSERPLL